MEERPQSITYVGWVAMILGLTGIYSVLTISPVAELEQMHISLLSRQVTGWISVIVDFLCGYGILTGLPWSRVLFVGWMLLGLFIGSVLFPVMSTIVVTAIAIAAFAYFLFNATGDRWFGTTGLSLS